MNGITSPRHQVPEFRVGRPINKQGRQNLGAKHRIDALSRYSFHTKHVPNDMIKIYSFFSELALRGADKDLLISLVHECESKRYLRPRILSDQPLIEKKEVEEKSQQNQELSSIFMVCSRLVKDGWRLKWVSALLELCCTNERVKHHILQQSVLLKESLS